MLKKGEEALPTETGKCVGRSQKENIITKKRGKNATKSLFGGPQTGQQMNWEF